MILPSWMHMVLGLALISGEPGPDGRGTTDEPASRRPPKAQMGIKVRRAAYQSGRSAGRLVARWIGQDGHDYVSPNNRPIPSDIQDVHIEIANLDPAHEVSSLDLKAEGIQWHYNQQSFAWKAELKRTKGARTADLFVEPARKETGRVFHLLVRYDDGTTVETDFRGGKASPSVRMPGAVLAASWVGQDGQDWTGSGPSVGPDGFQDIHIRLSGLSNKVQLKLLRIEGPAGRNLGVWPQSQAGQ